MHFIDLHYKGVRIRPWMRYLLFRCFVLLFAVPTIGIFVYLLFKTNWPVIDWSVINIKNSFEVFFLLGKSALIGSIIGIIGVLLLIPLLDYLANLQRLCRLIYTAPFYIVNNIAEEVDIKDSKVVREMVYFAAFWYRRKKDRVEITVKLDGSQFHQSGAFESLSGPLEQLYDMSIYNIRERQSFLTYVLVKNVADSRINISDVMPKGYRIPIAKNISWDIAKVPHALVVGATGGGKSFFLNALIHSFIMMSAELYICDPKCSALSDYRLIMPHVETSAAEIITSIKEVVTIMEERYKTFKGRVDYRTGQDFAYYQLRPVLLIVDEYAAFVQSLDSKEKKEMKSALAQVVLKGREAGVFVLLATQRPDTEFIDGAIRDQMGLRVALGAMSKDGYRMAFGQTDQSFRPPAKEDKGRGYIYVDGSQFIADFYAPYVPPDYDFIGEAGKLLDEAGACVPRGEAKAPSVVQSAAEGGVRGLSEEV